jgi:hypothetical protein
MILFEYLFSLLEQIPVSGYVQAHSLDLVRGWKKTLTMFVADPSDFLFQVYHIPMLYASSV